MRLGMDRSTAFSPTDGTLGSNAGARAEPRGQWARWSRGPLSYGPAGHVGGGGVGGSTAGRRPPAPAESGECVCFCGQWPCCITFFF